MAAAQLSLRLTTPFRRGAAAAIAYVALYAVWQASAVGSEHARILVSDLFFVPVTAFAVAACIYASRRADSRRRALGWSLLAAALASYGIGDIVQAYYEAGGGTMPYPGLTDVFFLGFYPLFFAGVLLFPDRSPRGTRLQSTLDGITIALGGVAILWYFALGKSVTSINGTFVTGLVTAAYPAGDLALLVALSYLVVSECRRRNPLALGMLTAGVLLYLASDTAYAWLQNENAYVGGSLIDFGYLIAAAAFGLAALAGPGAATRAGDADALAAEQLSLLPYLAVAVVLSLVTVTQWSDPFFPDLSEMIFGLAVAIVVVIRHLHGQRLLARANRELRDLRAELERLAVTDAHTGVPNYRAVDAALERDLERAARYGHPLSLLFLDLDHFKQVNDTRGHEAGDAVLRDVAALAPSALRATDVFGRWGGEEFIAVLPETDAPAALAIAERLRSSIADHAFRDLRLTASVGVATFPADAPTKEELVIAADRAMYAAKAAGRNRVVCAGGARPRALAF